MSSKFSPTLAAVVVALAGAAVMTSAMAIEATQFVPEQGTKTRAEVQAELAASKANGNVIQYGEATVFVDRPSTQVRALARSDEQQTTVRVVQLGEATQFIDPVGTRSRAEVRAETLAAIRDARPSNRH